MKIDINIKEFIDESINKNVFPSVSIGIRHLNGNNKNKSIIYSANSIDKNKGNIIKNKKYYDIASLTKPFVTVLSLLSLVKEEKLSLNENIVNILNISNYKSDINSINIEHLLSHSAGFPDHRNYYKKLVNILPDRRKEFLIELLLKEPLLYKPGSRVLYSDLGYMLLGLLIEKISGIELDEYFNKMILKPIGLEEHIFFNPIGSKKHRPEEFAPVEECPWRERVLQGEVSDENCWALGGVSGHAGLYGDISGVLDLTGYILDIWLGKKNHPNINSHDINYFLKRRPGIKGNTWALGFDTPSPGKSSSGKYFSTTSVGHLGFTGSSFWIDPERELVIVILSNRVHPRRSHNIIMEFRPEFQNKVVEWLGLQ